MIIDKVYTTEGSTVTLTFKIISHSVQCYTSARYKYHSNSYTKTVIPHPNYVAIQINNVTVSDTGFYRLFEKVLTYTLKLEMSSMLTL